MKNTKTISRIIFKVILYGFLISVLIVFTVSFYLYFDKHGNCLDDGGVWDEKQHKCRFDCDKWQKDIGCIVFNDVQK